MPINDLISREAAIAAVEDIACRLAGPAAWAGKVACSEIASIIAALPADRRWDELRAWIVARQAKANSYHQWDDLWSMFDLVLDQIDRLAPPADGAEEK